MTLGPWLLSEPARQELASARRSYVPTPEARAARARAGETRIMQTAGTVAEIKIEGVLTPEPDLCSWIFGVKNTAYSDIIAALAEAEADAKVKSVILSVDSPGGTVDGLFATLDAIESFKTSGKNLSVRAGNALSAAYMISAAAGRIEATTVAASFGSIGVATSLRVDASVVDLTSTSAPDKRPDVTTSGGKAVIVRHLDAIHELCVDVVARGRRVTAAKVNADFGRGATLLAGEAKRLGMIDAMPTGATGRTGASAAARNTTVLDRVADAMGLPSASASDPDVGDQVVELMQARKEGRSPAPWAERPLAARSTQAPSLAPSPTEPGEQMTAAIALYARIKDMQQQLRGKGH